MSLADELHAEQPKLSSIAEAWVAAWRPTLSKADRATFDRAVTDPKQSISALFRVCRKRGYPGGKTSFIEWVRGQRDAC